MLSYAVPCPSFLPPTLVINSTTYVSGAAVLREVARIQQPFQPFVLLERPFLIPSILSENLECESRRAVNPIFLVVHRVTSTHISKNESIANLLFRWRVMQT